MKQLSKVAGVIALCAPLVALAAPQRTQPQTTQMPPQDAAAAKTMTPQMAQQEMRQMLGSVPSFMRALPDATLVGAWQMMKGVELNPNSAIPGKYKELIGLAVAAQIPCEYCVYFHTEAARAQGASAQEIKEVLAESAATRAWSAVLNGSGQEMSAFRAEFDRMMSGQAQGGSGEAGRPRPSEDEAQGGSAQAGQTPMNVPSEPAPDTATATREMRAVFGGVPTFMSRMPDEMRVGAWNTWKSLELSSKTSIPSKYMILASLAVSAQTPCQFCIYADRKAAQQAGATEDEINEAIGMAATTRFFSTVLNGSQVSFNQFKNETRRILSFTKKQQQGVGGSGQTP